MQHIIYQLTIFKHAIRGMKYIDCAVQPSTQSTSTTFSSSPAETLSHSTVTLHSPHIAAPGNYFLSPSNIFSH